MNKVEKMITTLKEFKSICSSYMEGGCVGCKYEHTENVWECAMNHIRLHADKEVYEDLMSMVQAIDKDCQGFSNCLTCPYKSGGITIMSCITQGIKVKYGMDLSEHLLDYTDTVGWANEEEYRKHSIEQEDKQDEE